MAISAWLPRCFDAKVIRPEYAAAVNTARDASWKRPNQLAAQQLLSQSSGDRMWLLRPWNAGFYFPMSTLPRPLYRNAGLSPSSGIRGTRTKDHGKCLHELGKLASIDTDPFPQIACKQ